jgi:hypothetical protein
MTFDLCINIDFSEREARISSKSVFHCEDHYTSMEELQSEYRSNVENEG